MIRPILFSGDMVRAILDGRKTETRRPVKPPFEIHANGYLTRPDGHGGRFGPYPCPYGKPGDLLWVREPGEVIGHRLSYHKSTVLIRYRDGDKRSVAVPDRFKGSNGAVIAPWVLGFSGIPNGIFREACRLVLEVLTVRVERLRDITEEGARAEGFESRAAFLSAYRAMYKLVPDANPWVWVVGLKVADVGNDAAQAVMRDAA